MWIGRSARAGSRAIQSVSPSRSKDSMTAQRAPSFQVIGVMPLSLAWDEARGSAVDPEEPVPVDGLHRDHVHGGVALHGQADDVAGPPPPELLVELLLGGDGHAVHAHDAVAA